MSISEAEKADWLGENYHGNWEMWVDPAAIHDEVRAQAARIAELEASVRNQQGDNLCWFDGSPPIPPKAEFLESCRRYHDQIATQNGVLEGGRTIAQLEARVVELEAERLPLYSDRIANLEAERDEIEKERDILKAIAEHEGSSARSLRTENAVLRKALEAESATARKRLACPVCDGPVNACDCHPETG